MVFAFDLFEMSTSTKMKVDEIRRKLVNKIIPDKFPNEVIKSFATMMFRDEVVKLMGFALISNDWVLPLSKWIGDKKCLEVMAGSGALSYALKEQGVDIIATDNCSWNLSDWFDKNKSNWTEVENIDAIEAVEKYGKEVDIIFMSWPYMDDTAFKVLEKMREVNPNCKLIYIGEGSGGCTANDNFFKSIKIVEEEAFKLAMSEFKNWQSIYDRPMLIY